MVNLWFSVYLTAFVATYYILLVVSRRYIRSFIEHIVKKFSFPHKKLILGRPIFKWAVHLIPPAVLHLLLPLFFGNSEIFIGYLQRVLEAYIIVVSALVINDAANIFQDIYNTFPLSREKPIRAFLQIIKLLFFSLCTILVLSRVLDKSPGILLGSLGALMAVLILVFKDPILGFVGGFQLAANDMVHVGDWIEVPSHGANGDVVDISITAVKVRNFDKTIVTIPTYSLVTGSFINWRGMFETGGRRIKRSFNIDLHTIHFCDKEMTANFQKMDYVSDYLSEKDLDKTTNLEILRAYITGYLKNHPKITSEGLTFLVRHLQPTDKGLPIEIYIFTNDTVWANYEIIQAEVFEHVLASVPLFGLSVYQAPSGHDFQKLG